MKLAICLCILLFAGACGDDTPECQSGWKRCNGVTVQRCDPNTFRWKNSINCLEAGYDNCAEVTVRYRDDESVAAPLCGGDEGQYSTCATEDTQKELWKRDWICIDSGREGQGI